MDCISAYVMRVDGSLDLGAYMSYLSARQQIVASNIANIDTPGYKTVDLEMPQNFDSVLGSVTPIAGEVSGLVTRNDGNNVNIDRESRLLAEDDMRFSLATQLVRGKVRELRLAIEEGKSA